MRARLRRSRDCQMRKSPQPAPRQTCHVETPHSHHVRELISLQEPDPLRTRYSITVLKRSEMITINNTQYVHFLEQADALRRSGLLCDAIISVSNQVFKAHRLVLACVSRRLANQLALEGSDGPVRCSLESVSPRTFKQVLDFAYTRELEVSRDDLQLLLRAAEVLEMRPLEEQCRTQLENIHHMSSEASEESGKQTEQKLRRSPVQGEKLGETVGEACDSIGISPSDRAKSPASPQGSVKKARPSLSSAIPFDRVSVISRHVGSSTSYSSPWTFPSTWKSASTLRRLADISGFVPFHPLQQADQSAMPYLFSSSTQRVLPLLGSHFQSSAVAYSDLNYTRGLYTRSTGIGSRIKQGLLKRKKSQERTFQSSEPSYNNEPESSTDPADKNHQFSKCPCDEPGLRNTPFTTSDKPCGGCRLIETCTVSQQQPRQQEHKAGKPHQCQHCPKKFSLKHQLDTHHRVHTGEKPFECRLCGQRSRDYSAMIKHLRTHNGASPYRCTVCLEFCSSLVAMQRHIKNHAVQDFPPGWSISNTYLYNSHT